MLELGFAGFLLAHGGIHASFLAPRPPAKEGGPAWPFEVTHSWLLTPLGLSARVLRSLAIALVALTLCGYALAALGILGFLSSDLTAIAVTVASLSSILLLFLFFHPWLIVGVAIDLALIWIAMTRVLPA
jgi:hypothetical protein